MVAVSGGRMEEGAPALPPDADLEAGVGVAASLKLRSAIEPVYHNASAEDQRVQQARNATPQALHRFILASPQGVWGYRGSSSEGSHSPRRVTLQPLSNAELSILSPPGGDARIMPRRDALGSITNRVRHE
jgi:hypothetical protein